MNKVFFGIVAIAFGVGAVTGNMEAVTAGALDGSKTAVELAIKLIGYMALFLGLMKVAEEGGLLRLLARAIRPIMVRLFPDVPAEHPAMGAMIMNIAANMLGLTNAATPLGIKAMKELNTLNTRPGVATNAMVLFLAINTSGLALLPTGVIGVRAAEGSADAAGIVGSTLIATAIATVCGITAAKLLQRLPVFRLPKAPVADVAEVEQGEDSDTVKELMAMQASPDTWGVRVFQVFLVVVMSVLAGPPLVGAVLQQIDPNGALGSALLPLVGGDPTGLGATSEALMAFAKESANWVVPSLIMALLAYGQATKVKVYETFVVGAKEGFSTGVMIIPYLVAILAAVGMFRGSGAMQFLTGNLGMLTEAINVPGEVLPMALVRPLSGSGAFGLMMELVTTHGPDSYIGYLATTLQGSTDTTFYVLAVYFGAVNVSKTRHAVLAGLTADFAGFLGAAAAVWFLFGHLLN